MLSHAKPQNEDESFFRNAYACSEVHDILFSKQVGKDANLKYDTRVLVPNRVDTLSAIGMLSCRSPLTRCIIVSDVAFQMVST